jgi:hypothetical protein
VGGEGCTDACPGGYFCPPGSFNPTRFLCPAGTICPPGSSAPQACPPGWICNAGSASPTALCQPGFYCPLVTCTTPPVDCANSPFKSLAPYNCTAANPTNVSQCPVNGLIAAPQPQPCPGGTLLPYAGASSAANCTPCPLGSYGTQSGWGFPVCLGSCLAGTYGREVGASTFDAACAPCPVGTYSPVAGSAFCQPCGLGTYVDKNGSATCKACGAGRFSNSVGATSSNVCQPCPIGTFNGNTGQSVAGCVPCARGFYGKVTPQSALGAQTADEGCNPCPPGLSTASTGADSPLLCTLLPKQCPAGQEPKAPPYALSLSDCVPIVCSPPLLALTAVGVAGNGTGSANSLALGCTGCAPGFFGMPPTSCTPCPPDLLCPGFTSTPLANLSRCAAAMYLPTAQPSTVLSLALDSGTGSLLWNVLLGSGISLLSTALFVGLLVWGCLGCQAKGIGVQQQPLSSKAPGGSDAPQQHIMPKSTFALWLRDSLLRFDLFDLSHAYVDGAPLVPKSTLFGAVSTLVMASILLTGLLYFIVSYVSFSNSLVGVTLSVLLEDSIPSTLPWLSTPAFPRLPPLQGLAVLVFARGEPGKCTAPLSFAFDSGQAGEGWVLAPPLVPLPKCADGEQGFMLQCSKCDVRELSTLSVLMHHSCQSMLLEVVSSGPSPALSLSLMRPAAHLYSQPAPFTATSGNDTARLSAVTHTVTAYQSVVVDTRRAWGAGYGLSTPLFVVEDVSGRGYVLTGAATASSFSNASAYLDPTSASFFTPSLLSVQLKIVFDMQGLLSTVTVTNSTSMQTLFSSLFSLLSLVGVFRLLFKWLESCLCSRAATEGSAAQTAAEEEAGGAKGACPGSEALGGEALVPNGMVTNPLYARGTDSTGSDADAMRRVLEQLQSKVLALEAALGAFGQHSAGGLNCGGGLSRMTGAASEGSVPVLGATTLAKEGSLVTDDSVCAGGGRPFKASIAASPFSSASSSADAAGSGVGGSPPDEGDSVASPPPSSTPYTYFDAAHGSAAANSDVAEALSSEVFAAPAASEQRPSETQWFQRSDAFDTWYVPVTGGGSLWHLPKGGRVVPEETVASQLLGNSLLFNSFLAHVAQSPPSLQNVGPLRGGRFEKVTLRSSSGGHRAFSGSVE